VVIEKVFSHHRKGNGRKSMQQEEIIKMKTAQYLEEDEIDLRDCVNMLIKRKKFIISFFLLAVITSAIVNSLIPKVYEISSTIQLGSINDLLIKKEEAKEIILNKNSLLSIIKELNLDIDSESLKKSIKIEDITNTNLLKISISYSNIDDGIKIISLIPSNLIELGQSIYLQKRDIINERLSELEIEIKNLQENMFSAQNLVIGVSKSGSFAKMDASFRKILLQNAISSYENSITRLRNQSNELQLLLVNAKDFGVFDAPIKPKYPIGPNKIHNIFIVGTISLFLSGLLVFFMEYLRKRDVGENKQCKRL